MTQGFELVILVGFYSILGICLLAAFCLGGKPERLGAALLIVMLVFQQTSRLIFPGTPFATLDRFSLVCDLIGLFGFAVLGYFANRFWCLWAASFQLLSVSAHFARIADVSVEPLAYAVMRSSPTLMVMLALLVGVVNYRRRLGRRQRSGLAGNTAGRDFSLTRQRDGPSVS